MDHDISSDQALILRAGIIAVALAAVLTQFVAAPLTASGYADEYPELAYLELPYVLTLGIAFIGMAVALLAAWQLVSIASRSRQGANRWTASLTTMTVSLCWTALVFAGLCVHAGFVVNVGGPPVLMGIVASLGVVAGSIAFWVKARAYSPADSEEADQPMARDSVSKQ